MIPERQPEHDYVELTGRERVFWVGMFGKELRHDPDARKARDVLTRLMDAAQAHPDGWCECFSHSQMVAQLARMMWREPY